MVWAANKCKVFLMGLQDFQVITDHDPLIPILRLDEIENPRLQRLKTKLMAFNFTAKWYKGSANSAPDALSCNPVWELCQADALAEYDEENLPEPSAAEVRALLDEHSHDNAQMQEQQEHSQKDEAYQGLKEVILKEFPDHRNQLSEMLRRYWQVHHKLSVEDDFILHGCRLLIPTAMRKKILEHLHLAHQGIFHTKQRARLTFYWPGMDNDIENIITPCAQCQDHLPSNHKEPLQANPRPT